MANTRKDNKGRNLRPGETQRSDGSYMYVYKFGTKKKYIYDADLAELRKKARKIEHDKDDGIRTQDVSRITLNDMYKVYMGTKISLKASTRANYMYLWAHYIQEEPLANKPISMLRRSEILSLYTRLLKHGFAANSLESINNLIHPTLEMAVDDDYIRKNPSKGVYRMLKNDGATPIPEKRIALTIQQQKNFLNYISQNSTYMHWLPLFITLFGTGMRIAECLGLTWDDVDFEQNRISVNHNLIYRVIDGKAGYHVTTPKTKSGTRTIPMMFPEVVQQLHLLYEVKDIAYTEPPPVLDGYQGFVFLNRFGQIFNAHCVNRAIDRICAAYNAEEASRAKTEKRDAELLPHFSAHNCRHTFCTRLCESTSDIKFIQNIMGHADFSTTMDIYTHITQESLEQKAVTIAEKISLL